MFDNWNTAVVVLGAALLGMGAGVVGSFMLLRKRALLGDALSHATLPGICLAFMLSASAGGSGKSLPLLLTGAATTGVLGVAVVLGLRQATRLKEDTALGIVLSVFFGAGVALLGIIQKMSRGHAAGLESYINGRAAAMTLADTVAIGVATLLAVVVCGVLFRPLKALCFDAEFSRSRGLPVVALDIVLMALVVMVTVVGLQAVGLILVIALLVTPAAAARFWTDSLAVMVVLAAILGAASAYGGTMVSATLPDVPSGPMIVLAATGLFCVSLVLGTRRGVLRRWLLYDHLRRKVARQNLLRAMYEAVEAQVGRGFDATSATWEMQKVPLTELLHRRSWSERELRRLIRRSAREGLVVALPDDLVRLTRGGAIDARRVVREHRLWELYLIAHADIAPSHVDRDADAIEHVLAPEMIAELEALLAGELAAPKVAAASMLECPHASAAGGSAAMPGNSGAVGDESHRRPKG